MENKPFIFYFGEDYYIPKIEEFEVDFEYEFRDALIAKVTCDKGYNLYKKTNGDITIEDYIKLTASGIWHKTKVKSMDEIEYISVLLECNLIRVKIKN